WTLGPAISSAQVSGAEAEVTWPHSSPITALDRDYTQDDYDGDDVEILWVDDEGSSRVFTGRVDTTSGETLADTTSQLTDGTLALTRELDLRPVAWTLPVHPEL